MLDYYRRFWGSPLGPTFTALPYQDNTTNPESEEQQLNGDVLPGEPFLKDITPPILVRADYIRVFDAVKVAHENSHDASLAVVTGQPGIGKTRWIHYALRYCLGEKQPVVWCRFNKCYFFSESGVDIIDPVLHRSGAKHTWCFVDSMDAPETLPPSVCSSDGELFPVYITSPKVSRWRKLHQSGRIPKLIVMNPWTLDELEKAAQLYPNQKLEDIRERYHNAGPSARICLTFSPMDIQNFYNSRTALIDNANTAESLAKLIRASNAFSMDEFSHQICVIRRPDHNMMHSYTVNSATDFVHQALRLRLWILDEHEVLKMMRQFSRLSSGGSFGFLFEAHFQKVFAKGVNIDAKRMFRASYKGSCWHSAFLDTNFDFSLRITPVKTIVYDHTVTRPDKQLVIREDCYYIPRVNNAVGIDSLILHRGYLYLFQFTSGSKHDIKPGLQGTLDKFAGVPPREKWRFIFIVPDHLKSFDYPHSDKGFLRDHIPYIAQVRIPQFPTVPSFSSETNA
ncbi:hypothetical protein BU17DRAFT_42824 [Hysterangium stoloniferum]|nr:hypothetical protein BU17DRAFT_42824 [Hysterangium stoloniferum]